jgi:hypothetical protein
MSTGDALAAYDALAPSTDTSVADPDAGKSPGVREKGGF